MRFKSKHACSLVLILALLCPLLAQAQTNSDPKCVYFTKANMHALYFVHDPSGRLLDVERLEPMMQATNSAIQIFPTSPKNNLFTGSYINFKRKDKSQNTLLIFPIMGMDPTRVSPDQENWGMENISMALNNKKLKAQDFNFYEQGDHSGVSFSISADIPLPPVTNSITIHFAGNFVPCPQPSGYGGY